MTAGSMQGKICVITGATSGIGKAVALALGGLGAELVLLGRNASAGAQVARDIAAHTGNTRAWFLRTDLACQRDVRAAAAIINARCPHVDVLINNAGARFDRFATSADGIERTFATNHLGHFLLTCLLLDRLAGAPAARVITVASRAAAEARPEGRWFHEATDFDRRQAYARSKLANILFAFELATRLGETSIISLAVDPGAVATRFALNNGPVAWLKHIAAHALRRELVSAARSGAAVAALATDPELRNCSGGYFRNRQPVRAPDAALDRKTADELWRLSVQLTKLDSALGPAWRWVRPISVVGEAGRSRVSGMQSLDFPPTAIRNA